jgi:hypothetical protein
MSPTPAHPSFEQLVAYWLDALPAAELDTVESHYLGCGECSARLAGLAGLGSELRAIAAQGAAPAVFPAAFIDRLRSAGVRFREYRMGPGGSVLCTIRPEDDLVLARLEAPLAGVERLDFVFEETEGGATRRMRFEDVPFDRAAGAVMVMPDSPAMRSLGVAIARASLVAVEPGGERVLGRYTFNHRPFDHPDVRD